MKPTTIAGALFWRENGRTLTTTEAVALLESELDRARAERDTAIAALSDLQAKRRAATIERRRMNRVELEKTEAAVDAAGARVQSISAEADMVRRTDVEHRAKTIAQIASDQLDALSRRYAHAS